MPSALETCGGSGAAGRNALSPSLLAGVPVTIGGATMIMDAVEIFVVDEGGKIQTLRAYWDMARARTRAE
jgi:hypothetical protein